MVGALYALGWARAVPAILRDVEPDDWRQLPRMITDLSGWHESFPATSESPATGKERWKRLRRG